MSEKFYKNPVAIFILATLACILWGSAFPSLKVSYAALGIGQSGYAVKLQFAGYRFFLAAVYLLVFMIVTKRSLKISKDLIVPLVALGIVQTTLQYLFFYNGLANITGVKGAIMTSLGTFFSIVLPHFYYANDKMNLQKWLGLSLGFAGVVYVNMAKGPITGGFSWSGEGLMIMAALTGAVASIMAKELSGRMDTVTMTCYQMFSGATIMILFSWINLGGNVITISTDILPVFLHLALISSAGFGIWFSLLRNNPISRVSIYKFQIPIWGSILSALFIPGESLNIEIIASLLLVSSGIFLVNMPQRKKIASSDLTSSEDTSSKVTSS